MSYHVGEQVQPGEDIVGETQAGPYGEIFDTNLGGIYQENGSESIGANMYGGSYLGYEQALNQTNPAQSLLEQGHPMSFASAPVWDPSTGSYTIKSTTGASYTFGPSPATTSANQDAFDLIEQTLSGYGFTPSELSQLNQWVQNMIITNGSSSDLSTMIMNELPNQPAFQERFPAIAQRQKAGLPPISVTDYLSAEQSYAQAEQQAGLPPNWASYDNLIANDVSPAEYTARLTQGFEVINNAPQDVKDAFQAYYAAGVSPSALAAYFLDPTKGATLIAQQAQSALIGEAAQQSGYNAGHQYGAGTGQEGLSQAEALRLAQLGVNQSQAQSGFANIAQEQQVLNPLPGQNQTIPTQDQVLNATFGSDGQTKQQIALNEATQKNLFSGTQQTGSSSQGQTGAGAIQR